MGRSWRRRPPAVDRFSPDAPGRASHSSHHRTRTAPPDPHRATGRHAPHGSRLTAHGSRLTAHGSRLTAHGSRLTAHGSRRPCPGAAPAPADRAGK
ncbi:hypothetical protein EWI31_29465 [Streptomyces tsukubensis]|uniref:Uncharacterized protein n=1 Tax=Streptomyces tsukubensis (strain DSM 42081 / NBRC 108919 / NRRL 18488 / 9993) TaxID=1114943 RepID=A0A7G3UKG0_STRT9|nr:hypothetical protein STSU_030380 [Streptomyces tsukubensis NRRL18488]TAI41086.1 hypothetical protein EWI31_29465 [Streptomyces tsukubensis]